MEGSWSSGSKESRLMSSCAAEASYLVLGKFMSPLSAMKLGIFPQLREHTFGRQRGVGGVYNFVM